MSPPDLPGFVAERYGEGALDAVGATIAIVDRHGKILWVNEAWRRFARENGGDPDAVLGSYLDGISGPLRATYRDVLTTAFATNEVFEQDYECSSPDTIRWFRLRVLPLAPHGLVIEHTPIAEELAPPGEAPLEARYVDADGIVHQCSNCRRVREVTAASETWHWVPAWVAHPYPRTSHGLCTGCDGYYWARA